MKTIVRILLGLVIAVVVVIGGAAVYFGFFFDPNDFRDNIAAVVQERTGRELAIEGDLTLQYFPWIGFDVGKTRLSDKSEFGDQPLAVFDSASARVKLKPLFKREIEIGGLELSGLTLKLVRTADGVANWEQFAAQLSGEKAEVTETEMPSQYNTKTLGSITLDGAAISYRDVVSGQDFAVTDMAFTTGELVPGDPIAVDTSFHLKSGAPALDADVKFSGTVAQDGETISIDDFDFAVNGGGGVASFAKFDTHVRSPKLTMIGETITLAEPTLTWQGEQGSDALASFAALSADVSGNKLTIGENISFDAPRIKFDGRGTDLPIATFNGTFDAASLAMAGETITIGKPNLKLDGKGADQNLGPFTALLTSDTLKVQGGSAITMPAPNLTFDASGAAFPSGKIKTRVTADSLAADIDKQTMKLANYRADAMNLKVSGTLNGKSIIDAPRFTGPIAIEEFSLREVLAMFDTTIDTADSAVLGKVTVSGNLAASTKAAGLTDMTLKLDDSSIRGSASITDFDSGAKRFDLTIDRINADRYLPPVEESAAGGTAADAVEVPAATLRALAIDGKLKIGALTMLGILSNDVEVGLSANNGALRVHPSRANLYGGSYSGDIRVDASGEMPVMSMNESLNNVDFGALTSAMFGEDRLQGTVTGRVAVSGTGHNTVAMRESLNGTADFNFANGTLEGINVRESVKAVIELANKRAPTRDGAAPRTEFSRLGGTATITDGVMFTNDLAAIMPFFEVTGSGQVDLNTRGLAMRINTKIVKDDDEVDPKLEELIGYNLPVYIGGTYDAPQIVDQGKTVSELVGQYAKRRVEDKIEDVIGDKLGGLLGGKKKPAPAASGDTPTGTTTDTEPKKKEDPVEAILGGLLGVKKEPPPEENADKGGADTDVTELVEEVPASAEPEKPEEPEEDRKPEDELKDALKDLFGGG